ncbi:hypothetical protein [Fluviicola sp.]|uniref:hypothetical protein n=1 Tax=Fluviicola sp. TaxID=1917219 RepID=UPI0031E40EFE
MIDDEKMAREHCPLVFAQSQINDLLVRKADRVPGALKEIEDFHLYPSELFGASALCGTISN